MIELLKFQKTFLKNALAPDVLLACLSIPRGNGKSSLCGHLIAQCLTPSDPHYVGDNFEVVLLSGSLEQARFVFREARIELEGTGEYSFVDSINRLAITHKATRAKLRVISSNSKKAFGLVGVKVLVGDEPGAWEVVGGQRMFDAIITSFAKPDSSLTGILIGTISPADESSWWAELVKKGTDRKQGIYVQSLQADRKKWDKASEIKRCNPLMWRFAESRKQLLIERDQARTDPAAKTRFMRYRLNVPEREESSTVISAEDWSQVLKRDVGDRKGNLIVGIDLGFGRSWSASVGFWPETGRVEALAFCPGIPDVESQEIRDQIPRGFYQRLVDESRLFIAHGLRVQPVDEFLRITLEQFGEPDVIIADRFRYNDLQDACRKVNFRGKLIGRVTRWSECSEDLRAFKKSSLDGLMNVEKQSRKLITASLLASQIKHDDAGNSKLIKKGTNSTGRDDVVAALLLAAGQASRTKTSGFSIFGAGRFVKVK